MYLLLTDTYTHKIYCCSLNKYCLHVFPSRHVLIRQSYDFCSLHILGHKDQLAGVSKRLDAVCRLLLFFTSVAFFFHFEVEYLKEVFVDICLLLSSFKLHNTSVFGRSFLLYKFINSIWEYTLKCNCCNSTFLASTNVWNHLTLIYTMPYYCAVYSDICITTHSLCWWITTWNMCI